MVCDFNNIITPVPYSYELNTNVQLMYTIHCIDISTKFSFNNFRIKEPSFHHTYSRMHTQIDFGNSGNNT